MTPITCFKHAPAFLVFALLLPATIVVACNIPVFRYALERWKSDDYEVVVFHERELDDTQAKWAGDLSDATIGQGGRANAGVSMCNVGSGNDPDHVALWKSITAGSKEAAVPYVSVQLKSNHGRTIDAWHGPLASAMKFDLFDSPARREIAKRLLNGHSIVWLLLKSGDSSADAAASELLKRQCNELESFIKLPEGIGVPGSELYSEVPLFVKFSFLEIDRESTDEQFLIHLLDHFHADEAKAKQPLIAPVFGRGRMLEVIPGSTFTPELMRDLTMFMSGACSCQVKDRNPGIDLLMTRNWDTELFGENGMRPPINSNSPVGTEPTILAVPPGRKKK